MTRIQIVEDDEGIAELLRFNLTREGYEVLIADNADEAIYDMQSYSPDLVVLDWMLPGRSGLDIARAIRVHPKLKNIPIIMLTARAGEDDRVSGLDFGVDDYVTKPFSMRELSSRIKALLRRSQVEIVNRDHIRILKDIELNLDTIRVKRGKREIKLGPKEFQLLKILSKRPGRVYSREKILDDVWGIDEDLELRTVDVMIGRLRAQLNRKGDIDPIRTVRGIGYAWNETYQ